MPPTLLLRDARRQQWLLFDTPLEQVIARRIEEVLPALQAVERAVDARRVWAAGFIGYEAAPAFDRALEAHPPDDFPLLWFGLYRKPKLRYVPAQWEAVQEFQVGNWSATVTRQEYYQAIGRIKEQIASGNTYQVNYTLRLRASFGGEPLGFFQGLWQAQPTGYAAYLDIGRFVICSASPELFFQLDGENITTRPMKGTIARGQTPAADQENSRLLAASEKDRAENVMIVDMLRNDLGRIAAIGSVQVSRLFDIERYPTLWQMTSTVSASTRAGFTEIISALFPCASITGAPKPRTTQIIAQLETSPRRIYTGCIGFLSPRRKAQFNVAIRTALVDRLAGTVEYGAGGGIVWDSSPENEYEECQVKTCLLTDMRPAFSLLESLLWSPEEGYFLLDYHYRRLCASADYFSYRYDQARIQADLDRLAARLPPESHKVRLLLDRSGTVDCQAVPLSDIPRPATARIECAPRPVDSKNIFLYHKTTHRQVYRDAELACPDCDEVLLWNERREITETTNANIVVALDGEYVTPPVSSGLLAGTFRAWMLDQGLARERVVSVDDLVRCSKIYLINSVRKRRAAILIKR